MSLKPNTRTEIRRNQYKVAVDAEEGRRRRDDNMVEIRKSKREESLMKKRHEALQDTISGLVDNKLESFSDIAAGVWSDDPALQLKSTTEFRKLVSMERSHPPIQEVIDSGVVPRFVQFLKKEECPQIQFEAVWALTNIATGTSDHTKVVIDHNAVPIFVHLLGSSNDDVREQAVWALGNIARVSQQCREYVLRCGALVPFLNQLDHEYAKLSMLRNVTWTLSNLYCGGQVIPEAVPALKRLIYLNDEEVLINVCWAFAYLCNGTSDKIKTVIEAGVVPRLVQLLRHPSQSLVEPSLRSIGNIVTGDDLQTQFVINSGALPCLAHILTYNYKKIIKKEACWTISNITAGNIEHIKMVLEANLIAPLVKLLQYGEFDIKKEAAWAIHNVTSNGSYNQIKYLVEQGCIKPLCDLVVSLEPKIVSVCLKGLENILKVGEAYMNFGKTGEMNYYASLIDDAEGFEKIEQLQNHENNEISVKAVNLLETYFLHDEDDEYFPFYRIEAFVFWTPPPSCLPEDLSGEERRGLVLFGFGLLVRLDLVSVCPIFCNHFQFGNSWLFLV